jgi:hypothetical protein
MTRSRGKKATAFEALQKRLRERLPTDDTWITILGYEGEPREGHAFNDRAIAIVLSAILEQYLESAVSTHFVISDEEARPLFDDNVDGPCSWSSTMVVPVRCVTTARLRRKSRRHRGAKHNVRHAVTKRASRVLRQGRATIGGQICVNGGDKMCQMAA